MFYNWSIIGHEKELSRLEEDVRSSAVHHAYLFVGPGKIGKSRVAKMAAKLLQCPNNLCHSCPTCIQIEKKCHADTIELEDDGESIKIAAVREIIAHLNMTGQGRYKILLIENIGRLTDEAANCLLKTLEEPPAGTIFLFTVDSLRQVIPTISSRMRIVHFKKLPDEVLRRALKEKHPEIDDETLDQVMLLSLGRSGTALKLLADPEKFNELREVYRHIQFLDEKASLATRLLAMQVLATEPASVKTFLSLMTHHLRSKLFGAESFEERMARVRSLETFHTVADLLDRNVNPRLLLERSMLEL